VDVTCVFNERFDEGMFSSLKAGLAKVRADAAFVLPGDCPFASPAVYEALLESDAPVTVPSHLGRTGHPVFLRREAFPLLLNSPDTSSLRDFISGIGPRIVDVDDPGILRDIDTMEDYDKAYGK
jgi:molybdenum cofactor cytidylyltransferase